MIERTTTYPVAAILTACTMAVAGVQARAENGVGVPRLFATSANQGIVEVDPATRNILNTFDPPVQNSVFDALAFDGFSLFFLNLGSDGENIYSLPPRGTVEISTDGSGDLKRGPVEVFSDQGSGSTIKGAVVFELLGHSVSVPNSPPGRSHRLYVNFSEEERTAIAGFNPDDSHSVTLQLALIG